MAGKLLKENIPVEHWIGQGTAQASAETSVMLAGGDRNVTLVSAQARPVLGAVEVQTGGVAAQGTVEFSVLYLTQAGELFSREAQAGFSAVVEVENAAPKMRARVLTTVCSVEASEKDGRLDCAAQLRLEAAVSQPVTETLATGVQDDAPMAQRVADLAALNQALSVQEREVFSENFALNNDAFTRVVSFSAQARVDNVAVERGEVEVVGAVTVDSLLAGAEPDGPVGWQTEVIPFDEDIDNDAFQPGMQVTVTAAVRSLKSEVVFNRDGEEQEGNLHIEYVLELTAEAAQEVVAPVLADAYPLTDAPFTAEREAISFISGQAKAEQTQTLAAEVDLPPDAPAMAEVVGAFASPVALDAVDEGGVRAEGLMRVTLLYRAGGEIPLHAASREVPFALDYDELPAGSQTLQVQTGALTAEKLSPIQAQVRVPLTVRAEQVRTASLPVVSAISDEGAPVALPAGAVLYYPEEGETLWDVARRYRTTEEQLRARNPEGKSPVLVYRRLTEF